MRRDMGGLLGVGLGGGYGRSKKERGLVVDSFGCGAGIGNFASQ